MGKNERVEVLSGKEISSLKKEKCSNLKPGDQLAFMIKDVDTSREHAYYGTVTFVNVTAKKVDVCYLEGYKNRNDFIPFKDIVAKYDESGEDMRIGGCICGNSILLQPK